MARIKIQLPKKFNFKTEMKVRVSNVNYGGHLGNDSVLAICHEARMRFLAMGGFTEKNIENSGLIMIDAALQYKSESFYGDLLLIEVAVDNITKIGCDFYYKITNKTNNKIAAIAKTGTAFFDYTERKITPAPQSFIEFIESLN